jgi:hypothetical protein
MPYIKIEERDGRAPENVGQLTFALVAICDQYRRDHFADMAQVVAALECAKLEFYRRVVAPYEDKKMIENGDVFSFQSLSERRRGVGGF